MTYQADTLKKWATLVERLAYNTKAGKIDWNDGPYDDSIVASIGAIVVALRQIGNDFQFLITDASGEVVDSFLDTDLTPFAGGRSAYSVIVGLYRDAKRRISGADMVLDQLLAELPSDPDDDIPF